MQQLKAIGLSFLVLLIGFFCVSGSVDQAKKLGFANTTITSSGGSTYTGSSAFTVYPSVDNTYDLGQTTSTWRNGYFTGTVSSTIGLFQNTTTTNFLGFGTASGSLVNANSATLGILNFANGTSSVFFGFGTASGTLLNSNSATHGSLTFATATGTRLDASTVSSTIGLYQNVTSTVFMGFTTASGTLLNTNSATIGLATFPNGSSTNLFTFATASGTQTTSNAANFGKVFMASSLNFQGNVSSTYFPNGMQVAITGTQLGGQFAIDSSGDVSASGSTIYFPGLGLNGVTGDFVCQDTSGATNGQLKHETANCTVSSIRFKEHVQSLSSTDLFKEVLALRAVGFDYKNPDSLGPLKTSHDVGFIAEEVAAIDPYLASYEVATPSDALFIEANYPHSYFVKDGKTYIPHTVDYARLSVLLAGAIQVQNEQYQTLEARVVALENHEGIFEKFMDALKSLFTKK